MRFNNVDFFCEKGPEGQPFAKIEDACSWDNLLTIGVVGSKITIFLSDQQLINLKNSIISEVNRKQRTRNLVAYDSETL